MTKVYLTITTLLLTGSVSFAGKYTIPPEQKSLVEYTTYSTPQALNNEFSILVWNVHKGVDGDPWAADLRSLASSSELLLLQEATDDNFMRNLFERDLNAFNWNFAKSFTYTKTGESTGVATASLYTPERTVFHRTSDVEPFVQTPKTVLLSFINLQDGSKLAVLNIHGLNRTKNAAFFKQIDETLSFLAAHKGPVIYAGDFNTNNKAKMAGLDERMAAYGLMRYVFPNDERKHQLDWLYVRGCDLKQVEIMYQIQTSDHEPITARLECH